MRSSIPVRGQWEVRQGLSMRAICNRYHDNAKYVQWNLRTMDTCGDECFVHYSEVVPSSEVLTCIQLLAGGTQFVHCREVVRSSECPLSEVPLYTYNTYCSGVSKFIISSPTTSRKPSQVRLVPFKPKSLMCREEEKLFL